MTNFKLSMVTLLAISSLANAGGDLIPVTPYNIQDAAIADYESQNTYVAPQPKPIIEEVIEYSKPQIEEEYIAPAPQPVYSEPEIEEEYIPPAPQPIYSTEPEVAEEIIDEPIYEKPARVIIIKEPCPEVEPAPLIEEEPIYEEPAPQPIIEEEPVYEEPAPQPIVEEEPVYVEPTPQPIVEEKPVYVEPTPQPIVKKEPVYVEPTPQPIVIAPIPVKPKNISANGLYAGLGITGAKYKDSCRCKNGKGSRNFKDTTYGAMARVGYDINQYIGVEARGSKTNWKSDGSKVEHGGIYAKPMLPIGDSANLYGLVGLAKTKVTSKNGKTPTVNAEGLALGVGVEVDLSQDIPRDGRYSRSFDGHGDQEKGLGLFVDYERMLVKKNAPDLDAVSAGVTYDF